MDQVLSPPAKEGENMSKPQISSDEAIVRPRDVDTINLTVARATLKVRSFGLTDPGKVRDTNQDQFLIGVLRKALEVQQTSLPQQPKIQHACDQGYLFVVADGMGGRAGGERASALAIDSVETFMLETLKWFFQFKGKEEDKVLAEFSQCSGPGQCPRADGGGPAPQTAWHGHHADTGL
jgi:PPM family protein phosphatase